jgi:hypothetical protein
VRAPRRLSCRASRPCRWGMRLRLPPAEPSRRGDLRGEAHRGRRQRPRTRPSRNQDDHRATVGTRFVLAAVGAPRYPIGTPLIARQDGRRMTSQKPASLRLSMPLCGKRSEAAPPRGDNLTAVDMASTVPARTADEGLGMTTLPSGPAVHESSGVGIVLAATSRRLSLDLKHSSTVSLPSPELRGRGRNTDSRQ